MTALEVTDSRQIRLKDRPIPLNKQGDPAFLFLGVESQEADPITGNPNSILAIFEPWEVVKLVNYALYQKTYMKEHHRDYNRRERELMKVIRPLLKAKGIKLAYALPEEIAQALTEAKEKGLIPQKEDQ